MINPCRKPFPLSEVRAPAIAVAAITLWATLVAVSPAADEQPAPADSVPKTFTVSGVVKDALVGKPIKDAKITISKLSKSRSAGGEVLEQFHATTDANEKYTFALPTDQAWDQALVTYNNGNPVSAQPGIPLEIEIKHTDYAPGRSQQIIRLTQPASLNDREGFFIPIVVDPAARSLPFVSLQPGKEVTGVVQSADGKPQAGIKVMAHSQVLKNERVIGNMSGPSQGSAELILAERRRIRPASDEVETDANGRFRVMMITPGEAMLAIMPEKNYVPQIKVLFDQRGDLGNIKLDSGPEIQGRVLNLDGGPVKDQEVSITPWELPEAQYSDENIVQYPSRTASTDENGNFSTGPLSPGEYRVEINNVNRRKNVPEATAVQESGGLLFVPRRLKIVAGQPIESLDIRAVPTISIEGTITENTSQAAAARGMSGVGLSGRDWNTLPVVQGTIDGIAYRAKFNSKPPDDKFKINLPLGISDTTIELFSLMNVGLGSFQPHWRLGEDGPMQYTTKITFGKLNKNITDLQIIYGPPGDPNQPQPAAAGRARAAQPAGRAARGGARGQAVPVPADTNDDPNSK